MGFLDENMYVEVNWVKEAKWWFHVNVAVCVTYYVQQFDSRLFIASIQLDNSLCKMLITAKNVYKCLQLVNPKCKIVSKGMYFIFKE